MLQTGYSTGARSSPRFDASWDRDLSGSDAGPYRLTARLGKRGAADLYLGVHRVDLSRQTAAVKVVDTASAPASVVQLFNLERQLVGRLEHPHLARMLDEGTTSTGALYLAMEHIDALPVTEFAKLRSLSPPAFIELILQLCSAIEYLHSEGFVHRDLGPDSIVVTTSGQLKIVDFKSTARFDTPGAAVSDDTIEMRLPAWGYASPEVCRGGACARAADVYSMGVLLHELITGARPGPASGQSAGALEADRFAGAGPDHLQGPANRPSRALPVRGGVRAAASAPALAVAPYIEGAVGYFFGGGGGGGGGGRGFGIGGRPLSLS